jgi:uncharacterized protein (TIGR03067 family)
MLKLLAAAAVLAFVSNVTLADDQKKPAQPADKSDKKVNLEGTYTIVSGEKDGKALPNSDLEGSAIVITGTKILGSDKDKKEFFSSTYRVDTSKSPAVISMTSTVPGRTATEGTTQVSSTGLIKWDKDTVTIVYALPGGKEPSEFKAGEKQHLFVLKKKETK